jgi:S1-C subfamily serine protease
MIRRVHIPLFFALFAYVVLMTPGKAEDVNELQDQAVKNAVKKVAPSVVMIETQGGTDIITAGPKGAKIRKGIGGTSGVVASEDGYIISSAFNFANKPSAILVAVAGHKDRYVAKIVATDQTRMLTLLKIDPAQKLIVPAAAKKEEFKVGQTSIAIGRTLAGDVDKDPSVSSGIISAIDRIWGKAIQSDAKISPVNYGGPLVDIAGSIQGILVPASPRAEGETAGLEWYDSGIGFAIPMEDVFAVLPRLKEGKDLQRGILGVNMKSPDEFSVAPEVGSVLPGSAAEKAGIKPGDVVTKVDGKDVHNFAQMRHRLGAKYEGDKVSLTVTRGGKEENFENIVLGSPSSSEGQGFLGILPMRDDGEAGVEIRYVYPDSPADKAKLKPGNRITKIGRSAAPGQPAQMIAVQNRDHLLTLLEASAANVEVKLEVKQDDKTNTVTLKLAPLPDDVPSELPEKASKALGKPKEDKNEEKKNDKNVKFEDEKKDEKKGPETGLFQRKTTAQDHTYWMYVPEDYNAKVSYALVVWLHPTGKFSDNDMKVIKTTWEDFCSDNHMILVCPTTDGENGWETGDTEFVQETVKAATDGYNIDKRRIVAHGMGRGGQMALYLGFHNRALYRGVASTGAPLTGNPKERVANQPLAFFLSVGDKDPVRDAVKETAGKLRQNKFSVVYREMADVGHEYLDKETLAELARWVDSLDRM